MKTLKHWPTQKWLWALIISLFSTSSVWAQDSGWIRIDAPFNSAQIGCSGGPELQPDGSIARADTQFSYFVREGTNPSKLVIAWDGGGACWDPNTCIGSAIIPPEQGVPPQPIYDQVVDETENDLNELGGLGERSERNPVSDHTQVFIPYCTGDLHMGAKDTNYVFEIPGVGDIEWTIQHRGFNNVLWVLNDLKSTGRLDNLAEVFLTGGSAGGYGVLYAYPKVHEMLPQDTRIRVLTDSANGVINQDFYDRALNPENEGVWGIERNLAEELEDAFESGPDTISVAINGSLGWNYPHTRFGQYTQAFDTVQTFYYNVAKNLADPGSWTDPAELQAAGLEWTIRARTYMRLSALTTWNYRFYLAAGDNHVIIDDDDFYSENSAKGVFFVDWVDDMINADRPRRSNWRNLSCAPNCGFPSL